MYFPTLKERCDAFYDFYTYYLTDYTVPATEVDLAEVRTTFEVNFFAVVYMCKTFTPLLIRSKGTIVQIGSVAGVRGNPTKPYHDSQAKNGDSVLV